MRGLLILLSLLTSACASTGVVSRAQKLLVYDARYIPTQGGDPQALKSLERRASFLGVVIEYFPPDHPSLALYGGAAGISWMDDNNIRHVIVDETLGINGKVEVLAHEVAHLFAPMGLPKAESEVFADLVSVGVCKELGVDSSTASSRYLSAYKSGLHVERTYKQEIRYVTLLLTFGMDRKR